MTINQIHDMINRFFEAQLSQEEERDLLRRLLKMEGRDPIADEALAVVLASRLSPEPRAKKPKGIPLRRMAAIAASVAVIFGTGALITNHAKDTQTFAYVSGKKINDPNEIKSIVATQLKDIGESTELFTQTLSTDLEDIREALTADDI